MPINALLISIFFSQYGNSQDTIPVVKKLISNSLFVDCYADKNGLSALSKDGRIYQINLFDYSVTELSPPGFSTIGIDRNGTLWAADSNSSYYCLKDTGWKWEGAVAAGRIWEIAFDTKNNPFLITDLGIYNKKTEMFYGVNKYKWHYSYSFARRRYSTDYFFMDENDNLWIGSNSRNSREVHVFSTQKNEFITSKMKGFTWFRSIKGIFGYSNVVFLIDYDIMGMSSIYSYKGDTMLRMHHAEYDTMTRGPTTENEEYIGAGFFDGVAKQLYYYTNNGLLKARFDFRSRILGIPDTLIASQSVWDGSEFSARQFVGRLKKLFLHNGRIIYLLHEEGIFIFDGKRIVNLR